MYLCTHTDQQQDNQRGEYVGQTKPDGVRLAFKKRGATPRIVYVCVYAICVYGCRLEQLRDVGRIVRDGNTPFSPAPLSYSEVGDTFCPLRLYLYIHTID